MATLALSVAGAAVGSALLPTGISVLGATISGAAIGAQIGALAGSYVDQALFGTSGETRTVEGPRLRDLHVTASSEGSPIPRVFGRVRLGGQVIWATDFEEEIIRTTDGGGSGKGLGGSSGAPSSERVEYRYYANVAIAICEGQISGLGRVWADGAELDLSGYPHRLRKGGEGQAPDSLIESIEGSDSTPAFRGTAYIVFERLPLAEFGNRIPQFSFEVHRAVDDFNESIKSIVLIPGSGEFVYAPEPVNLKFGIAGSIAENVHTGQGGTDWKVAIDQLQEELPNVGHVSFVVSWFGTDLRAANCEVRPGVEFVSKTTEPQTWRGGGVGRESAHLVSRRLGRPAYGGTPSDDSVIAAIRDLKQRGLAVTLTPFILMDVPAGNTLPDPYGETSQAPYPWRGRITCNPAPGLVGSPDKTAAAGAQIAAFVGSAQRSDFTIDGDTVNYSGPGEWSYRRMVLHQAHLAKAAGGVSSFLIGTELRGLSWIRDGASSYPFVTALRQLAADVKAILGASTKVTYAADWTEYFGHQPQDGTGDVYFHLDPLWSSPDIDAVGIDCYWPLSDWRDGRAHLDYVAGARSVYDLDYLSSNIAGGEGYDWYYASQSDRNQQVRTPISDGAGKPWVFRFKDARGWWENRHYNRPGGVEQATPTAWLAQMKPIWLMEIGCPATDKGANQPNVFVDPKSSENALPYYSEGRRDDLMQQRYLQALIHSLTPGMEGFQPGLNPGSSVYSGRMIDPNRMFVYCWDARPFPAFPFNLDVWGDGENWRLGHWLNGRLSGVPLAELVEALLLESGFDRGLTDGLAGIVPGYVVDRPMSVRDALQPLSLAYFFDAIETGDAIAFRHRGSQPAVAHLVEDAVVETAPEAPLISLTRAQETDLPASAKINYVSGATNYAQAVAEARRLIGASGRLAQAELPIVMEADQATGIVESWLYEAWAARERASFTVPPSFIELEPGDVVELERGTVNRPYRITEIADSGPRAVEARSIDPDVYDLVAAPPREGRSPAPPPSGTAKLVFLDLPLISGAEPASAGYAAAAQDPWPGIIALYGSPEASGFRLRSLLPAPAVMGATQTSLATAATSRIDHATKLQVSIATGQLASVTRTQLLAGANAAAVRGRDGLWEVLQFETAQLLGENYYELSGFLRGQAGTESALAGIGAAIDAGADFVMLDGAVARVDLGLDELRLPYQWRFGPANRELSDPSYAPEEHAFSGIGLRPLSPVHVRATRSTGGDIAVSWVRRTRIGGDSWDTLEVPLAEDFERYELDVLADDNSVVRTLPTVTTLAEYPAADQIADFGSLKQPCRIRIHQLSALYGRGAPATATV
ncbi:MAG: glycoside hydrolase TIM-barrel-like domain-containing protein [Alphaproteobacteria bacterium]|nr:glycoside hydrolase TIM-barrel-like domain-containing protein [Alphaproteobacteria bacterium]